MLCKYIIVFSSYFSILSLAPLSTAPLDSKALARYLARHLCMAKSRGRGEEAGGEDKGKGVDDKAEHEEEEDKGEIEDKGEEEVKD